MMRQNYKQQGGLCRDYCKIVVNAIYTVVEVNSFKFYASEDVSSVSVKSL